MRILLIAVLFLALVAGSFWAGSWYRQGETAKVNPSGVKSPAVNADKSPDTAIDTSLLPGTLNVSPEKQQLIGVKVATVEKCPSSHTLRVLGRVVPDENNIYRINSGTDGWVKKILPVTTGSLVQKDELLATFYAPEFFSAIRAYLVALRSLERFEASRKEAKEQQDLTGASIEIYRNSLRNLGMTMRSRAPARARTKSRSGPRRRVSSWPGTSRSASAS
jgi:hypothetical protein